jgi:hypothetical protein
MGIFEGQNLLEFGDWFKTDADCRQNLAGIRWEQGFKCCKCGHAKSKIRKDFSSTCNICSNRESATANILFHKAMFDWAEFRTAKGGIKLHTSWDYNLMIPDVVNITEGKVHDRYGLK